MSAGKFNILIEQGATFSLPITYEDSTGAAVDLTTYTARLQARKRASSPATIVEMTTENGRITLGGTDGTIDLYMLAADTALLQAGEFFYDLELVSGGSVTRLLEGQLTVKPEVTR